MSLDSKVLAQLHKSLSTGDDPAVSGNTRQLHEVGRLISRIHKLISLTNSATTSRLDMDALELACHALHLPPRRGRPAADARAGRASLRQRSEDAIEMLIRVAGKEAGEDLLERAARILREMHHRAPMLAEARLLADAVSLDDFGAIGLLRLTVETARRGGGAHEAADGIEKRIQYGYWEARLKEGFHYEEARDIARRRLENAKKIADMLRTETAEDAVNP